MTTIGEIPRGEAPGRLPALPRRRWWLSVVLGLVIFVSGAVVGGGVTLLVAVNQVREMVMHPEKAPGRIVARLRSRLNLNDEQAGQVEQIVKRHQAAIVDIRREVQPQVLRQLDEFEREVGDVLTPDQQKKWHGLLGGLRTRWVPPMPPTDGGSTSQAMESAR